MTDIRPLRHRESEAERMLLEAGRQEEPPSGAMRRSAAALGLGGAIITTATGAKAASGTLGGGLKGGIAKWLLVGSLSVGGGVGTVVLWPGLPSDAVTGQRRHTVEKVLIDRARSALRSGSTSAVHKALNDYQRQFPGGALWQEAYLLRVEAYSQQGQTAKARKLAKSLLTKSPSSAHRKRLESLLGKL